MGLSLVYCPWFYYACHMVSKGSKTIWCKSPSVKCGPNWRIKLYPYKTKAMQIARPIQIVQGSPVRAFIRIAVLISVSQFFPVLRLLGSRFSVLLPSLMPKISRMFSFTGVTMKYQVSLLIQVNFLQVPYNLCKDRTKQMYHGWSWILDYSRNLLFLFESFNSLVTWPIT